MLRKGLSIILAILMIVGIVDVIPFSAFAETTTNINDSATGAGKLDSISENELYSPLSFETSNTDEGMDLNYDSTSNSIINSKTADIDFASTGSDPSKTNMITGSLFHNATYYNNDLATVCANLCVDVENVAPYFTKSEQYDLSDSVAGYDEETFHVGIGYKTIYRKGSISEPENLVAITFRGTGSFSEAMMDFFKDLEHAPYEGEEALTGPHNFAVFAGDYLNQFFDKYPSVKDHPIVYLVTGYSIGGAAANLLGARLTNRNGGESSDNVFVYTFGAIKAITSSANQYNGYNNIYNIYNYYDSWGPHGNHSESGVSDPGYKFGITYLCYFDYDHSPLTLNSHDMGNYRTAVETESVNVEEERKAGKMKAGQWWKLSFGRLHVYGLGDLLDEVDVSWNKYRDEIQYITIDEGISKISCVFQNCKNADSFRIPTSVTDIADYAFSNCNKLKDVYYYGTRAQWDAISIDYDKNKPLKNANIYCMAEPHSQQEDPTFVDNDVVDYGSCGNSVYYVLYDYGLLSIFGSGNMTNYSSTNNASNAPWYNNREYITSIEVHGGVKAIGNYAFYNCTNFTRVTIPDSVTNIGSYAFYNCKSLTSVTIPNYVTSIKEGVFEYCTNLAYVTIPDSVTSLGRDAFYNCTNLAYVTIPNSVTSIGSYAFSSCTSLTNVTIPNSVTSMGSRAFSKCTSLTSATISNSVTSIGESAFSGCSNLESVNIPNSVTSIGKSAFSGCSNLESVNIPNSVRSIGEDAFYYCKSLTSVYVDDITTWCNIDFSSSAFSTGYNLFLNGSLATELAIPDSLTSIKSYVFNECKSLTSVTIPNSVTSIGYDAFDGCINLTSVTIPDSVTSIGYFAFSCCYSLTSVTIPNSVTSIGHYAFYDCTSLTSATISNSVTSIESCVFYNCSSLTSVNIPNSVSSIGDYAFKNCTSLASVNIPNSVTSIGNDAFSGCKSFTSINIPYSVTSIGNDAFSNCDNLSNINVDSKNINYCSIDGNLYDNSKETLIQYAIGKTSSHFTIPNTVLSIAAYAFYSCNHLTSITIPNSVTSIGKYAFYNCTSLTNVSIPNSVTSIERATFLLCKSLTSVIIPDSVENIGEAAFSTCTSLTSVTIPDSVTRIERSAFYDCTSLASVTISNSITSIEYLVFYNCTSLESITIPNSVTSIGGYAFENCTNLASVNIPDSVTTINSGAFYNCTSLTNVNIPNSVTSIGNGTFFNCTSLASVNIPDSVTIINSNAFYNCTSLISITIPNSVTSIGYNAFDGCNNLKDVYYTGSEEEWKRISIDSDNSPLSSATIHFNYILPSTEPTESPAEQPSTEPTESPIEQPTSVPTHPSTEPTDNPNVGKPDYEYQITEDESAMIIKYNGDGGAIVIPSVLDGYTVTAIGNRAFEECSNLTMVTIPDSVTSIDESAFIKCNNLITVTMGNSVTTIGKAAFWNCANLTSVNFPNSVTSIGDMAFYECRSLTEVTIPDSVTFIGDSALGYYFDKGRKMVERFTISGFDNSEAKRYADEGGFAFIALDNKPDHILGDVDGDGEVSIIDATLIQRYDVGISVPVSEDDILMCGDVDNDGDVGILDATLIQRYNVGLTISYPIGEPIS